MRNDLNPRAGLGARLRRHWLLMLLVCAVVSCTAQHANEVARPGAAPAPPAGAGNLPPVDKLPASSGEFLLQQPGADFAADLAFNRCVQQGAEAQFTPGYTASNTALSDAAYCLYRLELDPAVVPATLSLAWDGAAPAAGECWLGLANWGSAKWDWLPLAGADTAISNPAEYAGADKHCYIALVLLGETPALLGTVGFGTPPPLNDGYTLFSPMNHNMTYLIDQDGILVHSWISLYEIGSNACLGPDGSLWRQEELPSAEILGGGFAGRLARFAWDNELLWEYELTSATQITHHDFKLMPNGNLLLIVWNLYSREEMLAAGCDPAKVNIEGRLLDAIFEITPVPGGADTVWRWYVADHLVQDFDSQLPNYGIPSEHPELFDSNSQEAASLDWTHVNAVDYNADLDQIVICSPTLSEFYVIDHSTTTEEAAGHSGGRYGKGGDILYRWGNPGNYGAGQAGGRHLVGQHNVHWIEPGLPGAGEFLIFNNRTGSLVGQMYSSIVQVTPPLNPDGSYLLDDVSYGPAEPSWIYMGNPPRKFFSVNISSSQRLPNGNTLVCSGASGLLFEVTAAGESVWQYVNPYPSLNSAVFRAIRYQSDYPGLADLPR